MILGGYLQELCLEILQAAGLSLMPSMKTVPLTTSASSGLPFNDRQPFDAVSISSNTIVRRNPEKKSGVSSSFLPKDAPTRVAATLLHWLLPDTDSRFSKTERGTISTNDHSIIQYITEPGDSRGEINPLFLARRCRTLDHSLVAGGSTPVAPSVPAGWPYGAMPVLCLLSLDFPEFAQAVRYSVPGTPLLCYRFLPCLAPVILRVYEKNGWYETLWERTTPSYFWGFFFLALALGGVLAAGDVSSGCAISSLTRSYLDLIIARKFSPEATRAISSFDTTTMATPRSAKTFNCSLAASSVLSMPEINSLKRVCRIEISQNRGLGRALPWS